MEGWSARSRCIACAGASCRALRRHVTVAIHT